MTSDIILKSSVDPQLKMIAQKVVNAERITPEEGLALYEKGELGFLGSLATLVRTRKNKNFTYFNKNIHIEPTNVCIFLAGFAAIVRTTSTAKMAGNLVLMKCSIK